MKLEIDSVRHSFNSNHPLLRDIYASFEVGQISSLLGRNGTGKSTLFKVIFGSLNPEFATVRIDGRYYEKLYKSNQIKFLSQDFIIPKHLKIESAIQLLESDFDKCNEFLKSNKILLNQRFEALSSGQRRLSETIIFLNTKSPFIILDEPFTHLMPIQIEYLKEILIEYKSHKSLILSDHQYRHLLDISDKIYLLRDGKAHLLNNQDRISELQRLMYIL